MARDGLEPAVLQAGTPVLIDRFGVPRARCAGGGPLSEAEAAPDGTNTSASLDLARHAHADADAAWDGLDPAAVLFVAAGASRSRRSTWRMSPGARCSPGRWAQQATGTAATGRPDPDGATGARDGHRHRDRLGDTAPASPTAAWATTASASRRPSWSQAQGTMEPGKPQIYTLSHDYVRYMDIDPDRPMDILYFDDPRYEDEELFLDAAAGVVTECLPGDVRVTITVDDVEVQSTTESISCTGDHTFTFTPGRPAPVPVPARRVTPAARPSTRSGPPGGARCRPAARPAGSPAHPGVGAEGRRAGSARAWRRSAGRPPPERGPHPGQRAVEQLGDDGRQHLGVLGAPTSACRPSP